MNSKLDFNTQELTDAQREEMKKHAGFDQSNITEHYDNLSENYEAIYLKVGWPDPKKSCEMVDQLYKNVKPTKEECTILDMGCGTGLCGQYLVEMGFTAANIVGVDASKGMLVKAEEKRAYRELNELFLG